jgi:hypothetical protein
MLRDNGYRIAMPMKPPKSHIHRSSLCHPYTAVAILEAETQLAHNCSVGEINDSIRLSVGKAGPSSCRFRLPGGAFRPQRDTAMVGKPA